MQKIFIIFLLGKSFPKDIIYTIEKYVIQDIHSTCMEELKKGDFLIRKKINGTDIQQKVNNNKEMMNLVLTILGHNEHERWHDFPKKHPILSSFYSDFEQYVNSNIRNKNHFEEHFDGRRMKNIFHIFMNDYVNNLLSFSKGKHKKFHNILKDQMQRQHSCFYYCCMLGEPIYAFDICVKFF